MDEGPLFRPVKRRNFLRKRPEGISADSESLPSPPPAGRLIDSKLPQLPSDEEESKDLSVAEILRQRKGRKIRKGIEFSNSTSQRVEEPTSALITQDAEAGKVKDMADRFTPHTGQVVDANKHMYVIPSIPALNTMKRAETNEIRMEYIESELAKRRQAGSSTMSTTTTTIPGEVTYEQGSERTVQKQPASLGKLHEIDLGPDATMKNIARTEAAARRLDGEEIPVEEDPSGKKPRLGRNGKLWRGRRRRNSNDVKRDKLVEEVLQESKLEIYDEPDVDMPDGDQAADDRIAEQFRRDFMDAIQSRRQRTTQKKNPKDTKVEGPKGPKLGGSRSARAAMHKLQEEAAAKK